MLAGNNLQDFRLSLVKKTMKIVLKYCSKSNGTRQKRKEVARRIGDRKFKNSFLVVLGLKQRLDIFRYVLIRGKSSSIISFFIKTRFYC